MVGGGEEGGYGLDYTSFVDFLEKNNDKLSALEATVQKNTDEICASKSKAIKELDEDLTSTLPHLLQYQPGIV